MAQELRKNKKIIQGNDRAKAYISKQDDRDILYFWKGASIALSCRICTTIKNPEQDFSKKERT